MTHPTPGKILVIIDNYCITVWNSIIIFHIKLKKLKPYDFDYINQGSVALIRGWHHLFKWYILFTTPTHPYLQLLTPIDKFLFHSSDMLLYFFHFLFPFLNTQGICQKILKLQSWNMSSSILNLNYTIKLRSILMKKWLQFITSEKESKKKSRGVCGGYSHTLPIRLCAAQRGHDFEAPDLEWGIHFRGVFQNRV